MLSQRCDHQPLLILGSNLCSSNTSTSATLYVNVFGLVLATSLPHPCKYYPRLLPRGDYIACIACIWLGVFMPLISSWGMNMSPQRSHYTDLQGAYQILRGLTPG